MSAFDKLTGKKGSSDLLCGNCSHAIVQDQESGKWFHVSRDTNDACYTVEVKSGNQCKCSKATPFKSTASVEPVSAPVPSTQPQTVPLPEIEPVAEKPAEDPVGYILAYLGDYEINNAYLILAICQKIVLERVKIQ